LPKRPAVLARRFDDARQVSKLGADDPKFHSQAMTPEVERYMFAVNRTPPTGANTRQDSISHDAAGRPARGRMCHAPLTVTFVDLGMSPLCESFVTAERMDQMEPYFPLHVLVCGECFLVQLHEYVTPEHIFGEYAYFSSYSTSWVEHARRYCEMI